MMIFSGFLNKVFPTLGLRNSATVRYAFSFLFLFAAIIGVASVSNSSGSYIKIVSSKDVVEVGTQFVVDVYVYADTPINAVDIGVEFSNKQVEILGIDKGESVITLWTKEPYIENGIVKLAGGTYKRGFVGEHKIVSLNVKALAAGSAQFLTNGVQLLAGDGKATNVKADVSRAKITTNVVNSGDEALKTTLVGNVGFGVATDIDGDGVVSLQDISSFMGSWGSNSKVYDFNSDGKMTFKDFSIILYDYFKPF